MAFIEATEIAKKLIKRRRTVDTVWDFLLAYFEANRTAPVLREICEAVDTVQEKPLGTSAKSMVRAHLETLEDRGLLELPRHDESGQRVPGKIIIVNSEWRYNG